MKTQKQETENELQMVHVSKPEELPTGENKIYSSLIAILSEVEAVEKGRKNVSQNYSFRGIDDMYNAMHPLFAKHKVFITSEVLESRREERATKAGGVMIYTIIKVLFLFVAEDGSSVKCIIEGEASDSGDKSTNKAMSAALKYALMQTFLIPTNDPKDVENDSPEFVAKPVSVNGKIQPNPKVDETKLSPKGISEAVERIIKGEPFLYDKIKQQFTLTEEQHEELSNAVAKWEASII